MAFMDSRGGGATIQEWTTQWREAEARRVGGATKESGGRKKSTILLCQRHRRERKGGLVEVMEREESVNPR